MKVLGRVSRSLFLSSITFICFTLALESQTSTAGLPLIFEPNRGQAPSNDRFLLRGGAFDVEFRNDGVVLGLQSPAESMSQVRVRFVGGFKGAAIEGEGALKGHTNYLLGNDPTRWLRGLPNYAQVRYSDVYPGTDLVFYGNRGSMEHDFELRPGADPAQIAFQLEGAESLKLDDDGNLRVGLAGGAIIFERPIAYQTVAGKRLDVEAAFMVGKDGTVRFRVGSYDKTENLVIDPVLSFSTYLSSIPSVANLIATDASGNSYVSGSATLGFPVTSGAFAGCTNCSTGNEVTFISKLSADGTNLIYSTLLGGSSFAQPTGIAVDGNGNAIVSGFTGASDFPTKNGQPIAPPNGAYSGFLVSLSADGSSLNYGTMLGSPPAVSPAAMTYATALAVDSVGNAYVTGDTGDGFYTSPGALNQRAVSGSRNSYDVYLVKFSPTGTLLYSAVLGTADPQNGGEGPIGASAIAVDAGGDAFVAGEAGTLWPISSDAYLSEIAGSMPYATPFVMEVAPDAKSYLYSTYLDYAYVVTGIATLSNGDVFVAGNQPGPSFRTTSNAYEQNPGGGSSTFLTELNSSGSGLVYSTVVGALSSLNGLTLDAEGDVWLAGQTSNPAFPLVNPVQGIFPAPQPSIGPVSVLTEFDPTGQTLKFSTFLGTPAAGYANSVAVDANQRVHVSGAADYGMYTTPGAYDGSLPVPGAGLSETTYAYVALVDPKVSGATLCLGGSAYEGLSFGYLAPQSTLTQNVQVSNCGNAPLTFSSIASSNPAFTVPAGSNGCSGPIAAGSSCTIGVQFEPAAGQAYSGQLTFTSNASVPPTSISLTGSGGEPVAAFGPPGTTTTLSFSPVLVGQTSPAQAIELFNNGTVPLTIFPAQFAVTSGFALAPGSNCGSSVPPSQACLIIIVFAPAMVGTINGTLTVASNDPVHPTISATLTGTALDANPLPTITALMNPSYPIDSGIPTFTVGVFGTNFFPASVVYINGVAQTTYFQSPTYLVATFSSSLVNTMGTIPVTVVTPPPGGGSSAPYPLIGYISIRPTASALTVDPVGGLLYAAMPSSSSQNPNTVIPINPATGALMTPIPVAAGPRALAVSSDGSELYVASTGVIQRFSLKTLTLERTFNLPVDPEWGQTYVQTMHVVPGSPQSIVVELFANVDPNEDGAALYNDSGLVNWIPGVGEPNSGLMLDSFTFTSPTTIYGLPEGASFFAELQVSATGLSVVIPTTGSCCIQSTGSLVASDGKLLYTNSGEVWDPSSQSLLGTYMESNGPQLFYTASVVPDTTNGHTYFLDDGAPYNDTAGLAIDVYNQASFDLLGTVPFIGISTSDVADLVRWGSNGFAFRSLDNSGGLNPSANQIVIATSTLITASNVTPVPILSSVSPTLVQAGGPAFTLQLTGSGFTSASTVLINGNARATTYVSNTSLTAQVLASDIATEGQLSVQVYTPAPGGGTSNQAAVSINPPPVTAPTVVATLSATSVSTAQSLVVTVSVNGTPTPTGTVTLSGGGYTNVQTLSGSNATFPIPAGSLAVGVDVFTAQYAPDSNSLAIYGLATGTSPPVTVTQATQTITFANPGSQAVGTPLTLSATASSGLPVTFTSATTGVCTISGSTATFIATGTCTIDANQAGNNSYAAAPMVQQSFMVTGQPTFTGSGGGGTISITPGATTGNSVTLYVVPSNGFSGTVNLSCSITPSAASDPATCSLAPPAVAISGNAQQPSTLTINTTAATSAGGDMKPLLWSSAGGVALAGAFLFWLPRRRRNWWLTMGLFALLVSGIVTGCGGGGGNSITGGGGGNGGTTLGTYTVTVTGTSGPSTVTLATVTLTVE